MRIIERENCIVINDADFSAKKTFECGQCFRFEQLKDEPHIESEAQPAKAETFIGVAFNRVLKLSQTENMLILHTTRTDFESLWRHFFDLDRDYESLSTAFIINDFMKEAVAFSRGLHILAQEPWESLCSFILSQCSNIPRIKKNIETLCRIFGTPIEFYEKTFFSFPDFHRIAALKLSDLEPLRCGYRAQYLLEAAQFLVTNPTFFDILREFSTEEARKKLTAIRGIGEKVANCFLLFGAAKLDAFPVDTWMKKTEHHFGVFNPSIFGKYAGIAQQYIFYYARSGRVL